MTPALLERRSSDVDAVEQSWASQSRKESLVEHALKREHAMAWRTRSTTPEVLGTIRQRPGGVDRLRRSFIAISALRSRHSAADWLEAASTLKRDAARLRNSHLARHASVLLAIADALTFTEPSDPTLGPEAIIVLDRGLALLGEPFISEPIEEDFLVDMLSHGWNLVPSAGLERPEV
jgi:hypothetical protein